MNHLTLDDIIEFISLTDINEETMQLISAVNTHLAVCEECRALARSFQTVYDEMLRTDGMTAEAAEGSIAAFCGVDADDGE